VSSRRVLSAAFVAGACALTGARAASAQSVPVQAALVHHAVSTSVPAAQSAFDEGLTLVYSFNRDEAARRFEKAATLDPSLAMAWWGVALAEGPNLNFGMEADRLKKANAALKTAKSLEAKASPEERRFIDALAVRYPADGAPDSESDKTYAAYRIAMAKLHADFPDDPDAATLYAESVMDVSDFGWSGGNASPDGKLVATTLEDVLHRQPLHVGANHYYVHTMDSPTDAQRALPSAERLSALPAEPAASHLVHMSGHIYLDLGMFGPLLRDNKTAVDDDRAFAVERTGGDPWKLDYFGHNLDFYTGGALMLDDRAEIDRAIGFSKGSTRAHFVLAYVRERRWDDALAWPLPPDASPFEKLPWLYAHGVALASRGDIAGAQAQRAALDATVAGIGGRISDYGSVLSKMLGARIAHANGDDVTAVSDLRSVIAETAGLPPEVFPPWYFPTGEWLGTILLQHGDLPGAEAAFRADLARTPHNARVLYGLMQTLSRQGRLSDARALAPEIAANWRGPAEDLRLGF
jgi:tetratricopeptide (TPR) repeat protein